MTTPAVTAAEEARVAAGANLLDTHTPGWFTTFDPYNLTLGSTTCCTLGHLYGDFDTGITTLTTLTGHTPEDQQDGQTRYQFARDHGFDSGDDTGAGGDYPILTALWVDEINRRRWATTIPLHAVDHDGTDPWTEAPR